jgi:hypothetical protein
MSEEEQIEFADVSKAAADTHANHNPQLRQGTKSLHDRAGRIGS